MHHTILSRQTATYVHEQNVPSAEWVINHNLGKRPSVTIVDSAGSVVHSTIQYINNNQIVISMSAPFAGLAYLN